MHINKLTSLLNETNLSLKRHFLPFDHKVPKKVFAEIIFQTVEAEYISYKGLGAHPSAKSHINCNGNFCCGRVVFQRAHQNVFITKTNQPNKQTHKIQDRHICILTNYINL